MMRGGYFIAGGILGNIACHLLGKPTACVDVRRLPKAIVAPALLTGTVVLIRHLYPRKKEQYPWQHQPSPHL